MSVNFEIKLIFPESVAHLIRFCEAGFVRLRLKYSKRIIIILYYNYYYII